MSINYQSLEAENENRSISLITLVCCNTAACCFNDRHRSPFVEELELVLKGLEPLCLLSLGSPPTGTPWSDWNFSTEYKQWETPKRIFPCWLLSARG
jgi:hypothetical protein